MEKRRFHSQNAGFEMSAPIGIGVKISAGVRWGRVTERAKTQNSKSSQTTIIHHNLTKGAVYTPDSLKDALISVL
jgi:hypothetical protein